VNRGPFPGNVPPVVTVSASTTNTAVGALVTLQATASDANGDPLAYYWDLGDGNFAGNQSSLQYSWARDGEYVARCTVSDMKGGTASASIIVRVGTVTTFLLEGHVRNGSTPLEGVLVKSGLRFTYTDTDGAYHLSRLTAGRQTLAAVADGFNFFDAGFENPFAVGPSATGLDFAAIPVSVSSITLIATGSIWKYLDTGVAPAGDWTTLAFDDSSWKSGPAKFGYGVGDEATLVGFGPNPSDRYVTTWFRQPFVVDNLASIDHLLFRLRRDDGAVVYLNGQEIYRENMPVGTVQPSTLALADVSSTEETTFFKRRLAPVGLLNGTNLLAVEIHQVKTNSTDLSFDLELVGANENPLTLRPKLAIEESGSNVLLSWPAGYTGWTLYESTEPLPSWSKSPMQSFLLNGSNTVTVPLGAVSKFFELSKTGFCSP